jgi:hypothetical protein
VEKPKRIGSCFIEPMLCLAVEKLPEGPAWQYEAKLLESKSARTKSDAFPRDLMTFRLLRDLSHLLSEDQISRDTEVSNPEISHSVSRNCTAGRESLVGLGA